MIWKPMYTLTLKTHNGFDKDVALEKSVLDVLLCYLNRFARLTRNEASRFEPITSRILTKELR